MFEGWGEYYLLVGSAAAALTGLLFVVATLNTSLDRSQALTGAGVYMTPIVFHLAVVLMLSAAAMVPGISPKCFGAISALASVAGILLAAKVIMGTRRGAIAEAPHWSDLWCYGVAPGLLYLALALVSADLLTSGVRGAMAIAALALLLLLVCIRNAWDLVTWLAPRS